MLKKYRTKPHEVEAIQWTGQNTEEVLEFLQDKYYVSYDGDLVIVTKQGKAIAVKNDYIVKDNGFYPCNAKEFVERYELIVSRGDKR